MGSYHISHITGEEYKVLLPENIFANSSICDPVITDNLVVAQLGLL